MRGAAVLPGMVALALMACGPIPVAEAERECLRDARLAERPRGEIGIFAGSGGVSTQVGLEVSTDFLLGKDPAQVFESCVLRRAGQLPTRPYRPS